MKKMLEEDNINIPFELELEIMKRLPVESLIRFRSVSKAWKSLIDSSDFIADYGGKVEHLLVNYCDHHTRSNSKYHHHDRKYVLIVDDDTFPQQKVSPTPPELVNMLKSCRVIGSSHGLLCFYSYFVENNISGTRMVVLWNIQIRKAVAVVLPIGVFPNDNQLSRHLGFGVCSETNDPKIVYIKSFCWVSDPPHNWEVEIFTLSTGAWRSLSNNLPRNSVQLFRYSPVVVDEVLYWLATDNVAMDDGFTYSYLIVSFDLTSEEFGEVNFPDTLGLERPCGNLKVSKLRNSLVMIDFGKDYYRHTCFVWMMIQDGDSKSFTKLYAVHMPDALMMRRVLEFRKSGEPILHIVERGYSRHGLCGELIAAYEPDSKHIFDLGIDGISHVFYASSYTETLLLHDQPNFIVYDKGGVSNFSEWRSPEFTSLHDQYAF